MIDLNFVEFNQAFKFVTGKVSYSIHYDLSRGLKLNSLIENHEGTSELPNFLSPDYYQIDGQSMFQNIEFGFLVASIPFDNFHCGPKFDIIIFSTDYINLRILEFCP